MLRFTNEQGRELDRVVFSPAAGASRLTASRSSPRGSPRVARPAEAEIDCLSCALLCK